MFPWWALVAATVLGMASGAALVQGAYMFALQNSDGQHDSRAGYSVAETAALIKERDRVVRPPGLPLRQGDPGDPQTEPIPFISRGFQWPVVVTYPAESFGERRERNGSA